MITTKKVRLADDIADKISVMIHDKYVPGDKLPTESELAQMFSVSRVTIREAISKLTYSGLIDVRQGEGTFVNDISLVRMAQSLRPFFSAKKHKMYDIFEFRLFLETKAAELAAQRATPEEISQMEKTLEEMDNVLINEDLISYHRLDSRFHYEIACCSHNELMLSIHELLRDLVDNTIGISTTPNSLAISVILHKRIYASICQKNSEQASSAMYTHIADAAKFALHDQEKSDE